VSNCNGHKKALFKKVLIIQQQKQKKREKQLRPEAEVAKPYLG